MSRWRPSKLPLSAETWEVGMIHRTLQVGGATIVGMLVVVEAGSRCVRLAHAVFDGEDLDVVLLAAMDQPQPPARPGRPKLMVFSDAELLRACEGLLDQARVRGELSHTPAVDEAIAQLLISHGAPEAPGIEANGSLGRWREAIRLLVEARPWERLKPPVTFDVVDGAGTPEMRVSGGGGTIPGVTLLDDVDDLHLLLEGRADLTEAEHERCLRRGLQFAPGLYPRVYQVTDAGPLVMTDEQRERFLGVVESWLVAWSRDGLEVGRGGGTRVGGVAFVRT